MTDQKTPTADGMLGMLDMLTVAAIRGADFDAAYRRAAHAFHVVEPPTIHHVGPPTINLPDVRVGQTHRVVWENARVCDVHDDGNGAVTIEYNDGNLAALFGHTGNPEPSLYLIADVEPEPVDDDALLDVMARAYCAARLLPFDYDSLPPVRRARVRAGMRAALAALEQHRNVEPKPRRA